MQFIAQDLASSLRGEVIAGDPAATVDGVSIDSRTTAAGNLFVPLVAERDGHDFIEGALGAGAGAYLTSKGPAGGSFADTVEGTGRPVAIAVADTGAALTDLGHIARDRLTGPVIGITGSVGKTSVKDLTAAACGRTRVTHASEKSFNNELGLPLTLANAPDDVDVVVLEMGARGQGHIAELCAVGRPTVGIVTMVALAHSELFGSIEGVAQAKGELIEALPADGCAILNADVPLVAAMASRSSASVLTFGAEGGDVRVTDLALDELLRPGFTLATPSGSVEVRLEARGAHMAVNAAAAMAAAIAVGVDVADAAAGLEAATLSPWRMEVGRSPGGLVVINDAYNANPTSMRAALDALVRVDADHRVAVVGEMAELGDEGPTEHAAVATEAAAAGVTVIAVAAPAYGDAAHHVADRAEAHTALADAAPLAAGTAVLVKGSRVAGLEALAADLLAGG